MADAVSIVPATAEDIPTLSRIMVTAMSVDHISEIMFPKTHSDPSIPLAIALGLCEHSFGKPSQHFVKAVTQNTSRIVAFGQVELQDESKEEEGKGEEKGSDGEGAASSPFLASSDAFNAEFFMLHHGSMARKLAQHIPK